MAHQSLAMGRVKGSNCAPDSDCGYVACNSCRLLRRCSSSTPSCTRGGYPWLASLQHTSTTITNMLSSIRSLESSQVTVTGTLHGGTYSYSCPVLHAHGTCRVSSLLMPLSRPPPGSSPLLTATAVELIASVACEPGSRTTEPSLSASLLTGCAALGRTLFSLFQHPAGQWALLVSPACNATIVVETIAFNCRHASDYASAECGIY
jgi:hypothetical protein